MYSNNPTAAAASTSNPNPYAQVPNHATGSANPIANTGFYPGNSGGNLGGYQGQFQAPGPIRPTRRGGKGKGKGSSGDRQHVNNLSNSMDDLRGLVQLQAGTINKLLDRQERHERFFNTVMHDQWQQFCSRSLSLEQMTKEQENLLFADKLERAKAEWLKEQQAAKEKEGHIGQGDQRQEE